MADSEAFSAYPPPSPPLPSPALDGPARSSYAVSDTTVLPQIVLPPSLPSTSASTSLPTLPAAPPIIHFDPDVSEEEEDDEEDSGRPKKKRRAMPSVKVLEAAASGAEVKLEGPGEAGDERGRRKIEIEYIQKKEKRHITFSKRKAGIMKKAYELATLTGTQVLLLVVSETGTVFTFTTEKFQSLVGTAEGGVPSEGQRLIQACLALPPNDNSPYISPPLDGALFPLPPSAANRPFEPSANIHGGQITLRTRAHRPVASNPRVGPVKARPGPIRIQSHPGPLSSGPLLPLSPGIISGLPGGEHPPLRLHDQLPPSQLPPSPHRLQSFQHRHSPSREYSLSPGIQNGVNGDSRGDQPRSVQEYGMSSPYANSSLQAHSQIPRMDSYDYGMSSQQHPQLHPLQQQSQSSSDRYNPPTRSPQPPHLHLQHQQHQQQHQHPDAQQHQTSPHLRQYSDPNQEQQQSMYQQQSQHQVYHAQMQEEEYLAAQGRR